MAAARTRLVAVWWEHWPIVAAGGLDRAAIVIGAGRVVACSPMAQAAGVVVGQLRRAAQRRCPAAEVLAADPDAAARAFEPVVRAIEQLTPRVELVEPGWVYLEARGPARYFGGDEPFARRLVDTVAAVVGSTVGLGIGIADGRFAAAVASRQAARRSTAADPDRPGARWEVVAAGDSPAYLAPQRVGWLADTGDVPADTVGLFARLGLTTLGALAATPAVDLAARFGPIGEHAQRLAAGADERHARPTEALAERAVERAFDDPVTQVQPLVFVAKQLADELCAGLEAAGLSCVRLVVRAETEHGERSERVWYRSGGLSSVAIVDRVRWQLDGWITAGTPTAETPAAETPAAESPTGGTGQSVAPAVADAPTAGVILLRLDPVGLSAAGGDQLRLWGGLSAADDRALRAVSRLIGMVGHEAVTVPSWCGGRLPAERLAWVSVADVDLADPAAAVERVRPRSARLDAPWPGSLPAPLPAQVFADADAEAQAVTVSDADGAMVAVSGRGEVSAAPAALTLGAGADAQPIVAWAGPWPLDQRWWAGATGERGWRRLARFQLVTADGAAHLVALEQRQWWLLATYS